MENFDRYVKEEMAIRRQTLDALSKRRRAQRSLPTVYVSGPMTGMPDHNHKAFMEAEKYLRDLGFNVWNPAYNPIGGYEWEDYMKLDLRGLLNSDMIFMLPGWENSRGAKLEKYLADEMKIPELKKSLVKIVLEVDFND